jgi:hypothetical protein
MEDFDDVKQQAAYQNVAKVQCDSSHGSITAKSSVGGSVVNGNSTMSNLGLQGLSVEECPVLQFCKDKLVGLIEKYDTVFSRHSLDCGEAKEFCHRIRLTDDRPFRFPYRRLSPAHYQKLRETLDDMEEKEIVRKSSSEYASPLVLVWKKNGDLCLCTDFRWLKNAHPLPQQGDVLAALGGKCLFQHNGLDVRVLQCATA